MYSEYATFETPDAPAEVTSSDSEAPAPGRPVFEKLWSNLRLNRSASLSDISEHDAYGWAFDVQYDGAQVWCMLQRSDEWLLITEIRRSLLDRIRGRDFTKQHEAVIALLDEALRSIGVQHLRWFSRAEFEAQARAR